MRELVKEIKMFFLSWDKETFLTLHEESNLRPTDSAMSMV